MEKTKMKVFEMCELKDSLMSWAREHKDNSSIEQMGQVVDMIKDLSEAEKECWEARYYQSIVEAMHEEKEAQRYSGERAGYDHWRYASGRFAPSGHGHYSAGYTPTVDDRGMMDMDWDFQNPRMGYTSNGNSGRSGENSTGGSNMGRGGSRMSGYHRYRNARMGYQTSGSDEDRHEMSEAMKEQIEELSESVRDIWKDADPSMKKELKGHLMSLIGEMS